MHNYSVNKFFGHFWQCWHIIAESEEDAWNRAEQDGKLRYQSVYREERDVDSNGYVKNLDEEKINDSPITEKQYYEWMKESIKKGMNVTQEEYEAAFGTEKK